MASPPGSRPRALAFGLGRSLKAFRVAGIDIRIDPSWLLSLLLLTVLARDLIVDDVTADRVLAWTFAVAFALAITACIVVHELAHSLVAISQGLPVRRITLFAFGGVSHIEREAPTPGEEFRVAVAGPLASIAIAAVLAAVARTLNPGLRFLHGPWGTMATINLWLAAFNLVPAFPMDGGRVLRSGLWRLVGSRARATRWAALAGRTFAGVLIGAGLVSLAARSGAGGYLTLLGLFLYSAAQTAGRAEGGERPNEPTPTI